MTDPLVDATWLGSHREEVVVADVRWAPALGTAEAERLFAAGHVPGAVFFDVDRDLAGTTGPARPNVVDRLVPAGRLWRSRARLTFGRGSTICR